MNKKGISIILTAVLALGACAGCGSGSSTSSASSVDESSVVSEVSIESSVVEKKIINIKFVDSNDINGQVNNYHRSYIIVEGSEYDDYSNEIEFVSTNPNVATIKLVESDNSDKSSIYYKIDFLSAGKTTVYAQTKDGKLKTDTKTVTVISKEEASRLAEVEAALESLFAEESRIAEESRTQVENQKKNTIRLSQVYTSEPNFVGGVDLYANFTNVSDKTIKYIYFTATAYNAVDDPAYCEIRGTASQRCNHTGPLDPGCSTGDIYWDCLWYNSTIKYAKITDVSVRFMDDTIIDIPDEYL